MRYYKESDETGRVCVVGEGLGGEEITQEALSLFAHYGISAVDVVK